MLSLKYRPKNFAEVRGQTNAVSLLRSAITHNKMPPAVLLSGIRGTGKTTLARLAAKLLNCSAPIDGDVCMTCENCRALDAQAHLDVLELDAASHTGVENMRDLIESAQYRAVMGQHKVFIIDEAHMLSKSAFNALLKNLEEPYPGIHYILATTEIQKIPDTIVSRCMRLTLASFTHEQLCEILQLLLEREGYTFAPEAVSEIAYAAEGSLRDAQNLLNQALLLENDRHLSQQTIYDMLGTCQRQVFFDLLEGMFEGNIPHLLQQVRTLIQQGVDPSFILQNVMDLVYWIVCLKQNAALTAYPEIDQVRGQQLAQQLSMPSLLMTWQILQKGYQEYQLSPLKYQTLEMVLVKVCFIPEKQSAPQWDTTEKLFQFIKKSREPLFYQKLEELMIIEYKPGSILCTNPKQRSLHEIAEKLKHLTGITWHITIKSEGTHPVLQQIQNVFQNNIDNN